MQRVQRATRRSFGAWLLGKASSAIEVKFGIWITDAAFGIQRLFHVLLLRSSEAAAATVKTRNEGGAGRIDLTFPDVASWNKEEGCEEGITNNLTSISHGLELSLGWLVGLLPLGFPMAFPTAV